VRSKKNPFRPQKLYVGPAIEARIAYSILGVNGFVHNRINKHFVSTAWDMLTTKLKRNKPSSHAYPLHYLSRAFNHPFPPINITYVSTTELQNIAKTLKIKHSLGYDEISTKILNSSFYYISSPLTYIINRMLSTGTFPNRLKYSQVKPLFKTGENQIIDLSPYSHPFQRSLKRLFIKDYLIT